MNHCRKRHAGWMLSMALIAGLAALPAPQPALARVPGFHFHPYDLGNNGLGHKDGDRAISRAQAEADLQVLAKAIDENSAYTWSSTFDYRKSLAQLSAALPEPVSVNGLSVQLDRFIRLFGDDHAQVIDWDQRLPQAGVPFRIGKADAQST